MKSEAIGTERLDDFIELSWEMHSKDPLWVPPFRGPMVRYLSREENQQLFLCEKNGELVGRVAAIQDPGSPETGMLGYFECIDDHEVAASLFGAARTWMRTRKIRQILGPMDGGSHRPHRLMTSGFNHDPFLYEPRNPSYYPRLFEANGFGPIETWSSFDLLSVNAEEVRRNFKIDRAVERARRNYHIEPLSPDDQGAVLGRIIPLLDRVWAERVGYATLDLEDLSELARGLIGLMGERHISMIVDSKGRDVGFSFMYPDYVQEVRALNGDDQQWGSWAGNARPNRLVLHTIAVLPEAQGLGVPALLVHNFVDTVIHQDCEEVVVALVGPFSRFLRRAMAPTREYVLYGTTEH